MKNAIFQKYRFYYYRTENIIKTHYLKFEFLFHKTKNKQKFRKKKRLIKTNEKFNATQQT